MHKTTRLRLYLLMHPLMRAVCSLEVVYSALISPDFDSSIVCCETVAVDACMTQRDTQRLMAS